MLNEDIKIVKKEKMEYPPIPKNIYQAEILDINLKDAKGKFAQPGEKNFSFQFTLLEGEDKGKSLRGRNIWNNFVPTYLYIGKAGKNDLYRILEASLGRELEPAEEANFDKNFINNLIGQQLRIMVEPKRVGDRVFDNVTDYLTATSKLPSLTAEEKEKSKVKKKQEEVPDVNPNLAPVGEEPEINLDEIF